MGTAALEDLVSDELPPDSPGINLRLAYEAYPRWLERLGQPEPMRSFLANCTSTVPFYRRLFAGDVPPLRRFPVVGRADHDADRRQFVSVPFDDLLAKKMAIHTNGTLGPSLRVAWDLPTLFEFNHASYLRFSTALPEFLTSLVPGAPSVFVVSDLPGDRRFSLVMPALEGTVLRRLVLSRDAATDEALVRYLRGAPVALLHGKPSVLLRLIELDALLAPERRITPTAVVCSGENLYPDDRDRLAAWFGCPVADAYVASESGMIALECPHRTGLHVQADALAVEVETADGSTAPVGTGRLLITNTINWRHAFVRYRLGDRATVTTGACACGHDGQTIVALPGRERAAYGTGGEPIAAADLAAVIEAAGAGAVRQYQVAPGDDRQIVVSWLPEPSADERRTSAAVAGSLRKRFPGARFAVRRVPVINTPGGKLRRFL
ncbi:hypothetical protein [Actinoplanes sp. NPDC049599]|uniref:hypothetical protein n=1 Tax=Actinoplanes sp. NPDC049599 TaxID=3363903 RepID=UPI00378EE6EC